MMNATAAFSIIAQEAWGHKLSDGDFNDGTRTDDEQLGYQRSRRRYKVSSFAFHAIGAEGVRGRVHD